MKITPIRLRRINAGITDIDEAVKALGISKSTFYKLEQGRTIPSSQLIARIAKVYKCSIDDIFKDLRISGKAMRRR